MKYNFIIVLKVKWEKKVILKSWIRPHCFKMTNILYVQLPIKSNKWYLSSRLYELEDNGRIVEKGSFEELISKKGDFYNLYSVESEKEIVS